jgi:hypothetical protein
MAKGGNILSEIALIPARPKWLKFGRKKYEAVDHEAVKNKKSLSRMKSE